MGKDLNSEQLETIAIHCTLGAMKNNNNTNQKQTGMFDFGIAPFIREGKYASGMKVCLVRFLERFVSF